MKILFVHRSFPGQFKHLVPALIHKKIHVVAISANKFGQALPGVKSYSYSLSRGNGEDTHELCLETESKVLRGEAVAKIAYNLKKSGYIPDIIYGHPGWGECLFLSDIWPNSPQLHYVEYGYGEKDTDLDFEDEYIEPRSILEAAKCRMKNANVLLNLDSMSWGITPTHFQKSSLPVWSHDKISVIHDGINTAWAQPCAAKEVILNNKKFTSKDQVISFVNRTFEPYRGIHVFIRSLVNVLNDNRNAQVLLIGKDTPQVSYGAHREDGLGWLSYLKSKYAHDIDWSRVHLVGTVKHEILRNIFQITSCHVYLTYPFVLSWSMLEAMSCGAVVIGSNTKPVNEVIKHQHNGIIVDFHDHEALTKEIGKALYEQNHYATIKSNARQTILDNYSLNDCINKQYSLIEKLVNHKLLLP